MKIMQFGLVIALWSSGCATSQMPAPECPEPVEQHLEKEAEAHQEHAETPAYPGGVGYTIKMATDINKPVAPQVLQDDAQVKIAVVTLQPGATMPEHAAPVSVTVQTIAGSGTMTISGKEHRLVAGSIYYMDANAPHALVAEAEKPWVVLVHYIKGGKVTEDHKH